MDTITPRRCCHCEADLAPRDAFWAHYRAFKNEPLIFCERCVDPSQYALGLKAPSVAPKGWGPAPMGSAKRRKPTGVQAERSEP